MSIYTIGLIVSLLAYFAVGRQAPVIMLTAFNCIGYTAGALFLAASSVVVRP